MPDSKRNHPSRPSSAFASKTPRFFPDPRLGANAYQGLYESPSSPPYTDRPKSSTPGLSSQQIFPAEPPKPSSTTTKLVDNARRKNMMKLISRNAEYYSFDPCRHVCITILEAHGLYECEHCQQSIASVVRQEICPSAHVALQMPTAVQRPTTAVESAVSRVVELSSYIWLEDKKQKSEKERDMENESNNSMSGKHAKSKDDSKVRQVTEKMESLESGIDSFLDDMEDQIRQRDDLMDKVDRLVGAWTDQAGDGKENTQKTRKGLNPAAAQLAAKKVTKDVDTQTEYNFDAPDTPHTPDSSLLAPLPDESPDFLAFARPSPRKNTVVMRPRKRCIKGVPEAISELFLELPLEYDGTKKGVAWTVKAVRDIYSAKVEQDAFDASENNRPDEFNHFIYELYQHKHGSRKTAEMRLVDLFVSANAHRDASGCLMLFCRFFGMFQPLDPNAFNFYMTAYRQLVKSASTGIFKQSDDGTVQVGISRAVEVSQSLFGAHKLPSTVEAVLCSKGYDVSFFLKEFARRLQDLAFVQMKRSSRQPNANEKPSSLDLDSLMDLYLDERENENRRFMAFVQRLLAEGDTHGDGRLTYLEFASMMQQLVPDTSPKQMLHYFRDALGDEEDLDSILFSFYRTNTDVRLNPRRLAGLVQDLIKGPA